MPDAPIVNAEAAEDWNGQEGEHWVSHQARYAVLTKPFTDALLDVAAIAPTDRVLDIGCGCGMTTRAAARRAPRGDALGVDLSAPMLERATADAAAEGLTNVQFEQADAQVFPFPPGAFDLAISSFGVMFFTDPVAAFRNVANAVRPGGRLVFVCWQELVRNEWITVPAAGALAHVPMPDLGSPDEPGGFSLAQPERISLVLAQAGFTDIEVAGMEAPMRMGDDADDAVEFIRGTSIAQRLLADVDPDTTRRAMAAVRDALLPYESADDLCLAGAVWVVTAHRP